MIINRIMNWWRNRRLFVIADPNDNGVTLSHALYNHLANSAMPGRKHAYSYSIYHLHDATASC